MTLASDYGNLGIVFAIRGDLDRAEEMHKKSLEINEKLGRLEGMASDYGNLGLVFYTRGDLDRAEEMYKKSLELARRLGATRLIAQIESLLDALPKSKQKSKKRK